MDERLNYAPCGYIGMTVRGMIAEVNQTFLELTGYSKEDLLDKHLESLMSTANRIMFHSFFYPQINLNGYVAELFINLKGKDGESIPFLMNARALAHDGREVIDCVLLEMRKRIDYEQDLRSAKKQMEDAYMEKDRALEKLRSLHKEIEQKQAELMEINAVLLELSNTDKLTGLKNRRFFQEKLDECIRRHEVEQRAFSLLIADIDHFKKVNDTWGHPAGDEVLRQAAGILRSYVREGDATARYGGEEFAMILCGADAAEAKERAERLRMAVAGSDWISGSLTISIGIATAEPGDTESALLSRADQALYASKQNGRNRVIHYADMNTRMV